MTDLSPAAQAILDAYQFAPIDDHLTAAAVLRSVADQVVPVELHPQVYEDCCQYSNVQARICHLAINEVADRLVREVEE